jgi:acyl-CoA synthetase (AMP-forming)/AMP-acid ligase II
MTAGRVPAMINFTAGAANILAACRAAQVDTILSSRTFIEKAKLTNLVGERYPATYAGAGDAEAAAFAEWEDADTTKLLFAGYIFHSGTEKKVVVLPNIVVF